MTLSLDKEKAAEMLARLEAERAERIQHLPLDERHAALLASDWLGWMREISIRPFLRGDPDVVVASGPPPRAERPSPGLRRPSAPPDAPDLPPTEFKQIMVQIAPPSDDGDPGTVLLGWWRVSGRALTLQFESGSEVTRILSRGEEPERVARQMLRGDRGPRSGPLRFPDVGIA